MSSAPSGSSAGGKSGGQFYADKLCSSLCSGWFPFDSDLFESIQEGLKNGKYTNDQDLLVEELKQDFSLFAYCVRELSEVIASYSAEKVIAEDPLRVVRSASLDQLSTVLQVEPGKISKHVLPKEDRPQVRLLYASMVSASTAEALAGHMEVDPESAFSCALFRQLGLALIAYNYPHVFERVLVAIKGGETLDACVGRLLGITPSMLGITIARRWRMGKAFLAGMGDPFALEDPEAREIGERIARACKVGEALARANDPEHYPTAAGDWDSAAKEIEKILGRGGLELVLYKVEQACKVYGRICPSLVERPKSSAITVDLAVREYYGQKLFEANSYIERCPEFLQEQLETVYEKLDASSVSQEALGALVRQCITSVGFARGCLYLLDPEQDALLPRVQIGDSKSCQFPSQRYRLSQTESIIVVSFNTESLVVGGGAVLCLAGVLGRFNRLGVLYLEISRANIEGRREEVIDSYCAINQALGDCLSVQ